MANGICGAGGRKPDSHDGIHDAVFSDTGNGSAYDSQLYHTGDDLSAPALVALGVPAIAAHMFVFYFGIVADITPPVALAAFQALE